MLGRLNLYWISVLCLLTTAYQLSGQEDNVEDGFVQFFYPNQQVSSEGTMKDGKPDGYWKTFYVTGVSKSQGIRTNYLLDSTWNFYNQTGDLTQRINYKIGEKSGYSISYSYRNPLNPGQPTIITKELYVNGQKEGNSFYYHPTGELKLIVLYGGGKKHKTEIQ